MSARPALARETLASSQWSPRGSQSSDASNRDASTDTGCTTLPEPIGCSQTDIKTDIETIAAYLAKERAPKAVQAAMGRVSDAYAKHVD